MTTLVTGATGFLGRRLVAVLAPHRPLRVLVRGAAARPAGAGFPAGVEVVEGDVADAAAVRRAVAGCDAVVHAAALVKILAPAADFERINVGGLENVLAAAAAEAVARVVYVSSFMALGPSDCAPGGVLDESAARAGDAAGQPPWINAYERTKALADRVARRAVAAGQPLNVVYPAVIYGPGEMTEGNLVVRHLLDLLHRRLPALLGSPERRWSYVFVEDVARGIALVLADARPGARYVLAGENVRQGDFYSLVAELSGVPAPRRRLPDGAAKVAGAVQKGWARLRGTTPALTPDLVEVYRHDWAYSSARAAAELGYSFRPLRQGLAATLDWLRESGQWRG
jgi:nucleoside-diphosphate-sugar epimerase